MILAVVGIGVRSWFIEQSGLSEDQVLLGITNTFIHEVSAANLPVDPAVDAELLSQADYAYRHLGPAGFIIDDSVPELAEKFAKIYSGQGVPAATVSPAEEVAVGVAILAPLLAWGLLDWKPLTDIEPPTRPGGSEPRPCERSSNSRSSAKPERAQRSRPRRKRFSTCSSS
ncbi:hypothetical protein ABZ599_39300 [Streptomyces misionensis]|uniref:hypothetical protein n=1 Tax=Streptomyces misionensis TaxID=67331 RepID=UPI0033E56FB4